MSRGMKIKVLLILAAALALLMVNAAVFAYYPVTITVTGVQPVILELGDNAGKDDLGADNRILVTLGPKNASASITLHPTYHTTYYKNVTVIKNLDSKAYYVAIRVNDVADPSVFTEASLIICDSSGATIATIDLTATGTSSWLGPLGAGDNFSLDFRFNIDEGVDLPSAETIGFQVIYSPQNVEAAP